MILLAGKTSALYHKHCREHRLASSTEPLHSLQAEPAQETAAPSGCGDKQGNAAVGGYLHRADSGTPREARPVQEEKGQAAVSPCQAPQAPSSLSGSQALEAPET